MKKRRGYTACCPKCGSIRVTLANRVGRCNERDCGHYGIRGTFTAPPLARPGYVQRPSERRGFDPERLES